MRTKDEKKPLRVLHVMGAPLHSGAGRGVRALHEALKSEGIGSAILGRVEKGFPPQDTITAISTQQRVLTGVANRLFRWRLQRKNGDLSDNFDPIAYGLNLHGSRQYAEADIVHLQWVSGSTLGPGLFQVLAQECRPVIWTLRDMWPFTGGCHFSADCKGYEVGCQHCPLLGGGQETATSAREALFKRDHINDNFTFVAISNKIAEEARRSFVLKGRKVRIIPNSVMLDRFKPMEKLVARNALDLPEGKLLLATGSLNLAEPRKGSQTLAVLLEAYRNDARVHWAIFGKGVEELVQPVPDNCTVFGSIDDDRKLNQIYAAADLFVMPSLQESFGKVTVEAMGSGTPVIAYDNTPAQEMIRNGETGWLVKHGDSAAFVAAVELAVVEGRVALAVMGQRAHKDAHLRFSLAVVTHEHIELYKDVLGNG